MGIFQQLQKQYKNIVIYLSKMSKWEKWDRVVQFRLNSVLHSFRSITSGLRRPSSFACADGRETQKETFFLGKACAYSFFHALTLGALAMITPQQSETQAVAHRWPHAQDGRCCLASLRSRRQANPVCHPTTTRLNITGWHVRSLVQIMIVTPIHRRSQPLPTWNLRVLVLTSAHSVKLSSEETDPSENVTATSSGQANLWIKT